MPHIPLLDEVALIAALGVLVTLVLSRFRLPAVAGLLLTGALVGPSGFGLVRSLEAIEVLAELGVVFLLFTIGLEFSVSRLATIMRQVAVGGALQVGLTLLATAGVARGLGWSWGKAIFLGCVFALSSTAIVLRALTERRELDAPHGRFIVGTLIFQDLCVVPMVLVIPTLAGGEGGGLGGVALALAKAAGVVAVTIVLARRIVPRLLAWVDTSRSREVFLLAILALCLGAAWLTGSAGLSLALGAFLGGMVVADTEYGHRAMSDVLPLRDAFASLFFVSLGTFFDVREVLAHPWLVLGLTAGFVVGKGFLATLAASVMRFPARVAWLAGVGLGQFGEFGFVLTSLAATSGLVTADEVAPLLSAGIISMFLTPLLVRLAPHVTGGERLLAPLEKLLGVRSIDEADVGHEVLEGHVVVVGYGLAGRMVSEALRQSGVHVVALELNADTVKAARREGLPVFYGDATSSEALEHAHVSRAKAVVLVVNDPPALERIVDTLKRVAPAVPIVLRTKYLAEAGRLTALGVREVVAEEVEGGLELVVRVLRLVGQPRNAIEARLREARRDTKVERRLTVPRPTFGELRVLADLKVEPVSLEESSQAIGKSVVELNVRKNTGASVVAVARGGALVQPYAPTMIFEPGDLLFLAGEGEQVRRALELFTQRPPEARERAPDQPG